MQKNRIFLFLLPALGMLAAFFIYPLLLAFKMSFTDFKGVGEASYVGLANYNRIFEFDRYVESLIISLKYAFIVVVIQNGLGLFFAASLQRLPLIRNFSRAALFTPAMMSFVIVGYVWQFIYSPFGGALNTLLIDIGLGAFQQPWLGDKSLAIYAVAAAHIWMFTGYSTAIFLAGFANIPDDLNEASKIDGASSWRRFRYIELPLLAPAMTINVMLSTIGALKTFELPFIMTRGGPDGATRTLGLEIIDQLFAKYSFGFASALSVVMLIVIVCIALFLNKVLRARELRT